MLTKAELQRLRSLHEKKHREALGLFVIEGEKVIAELLGAKFRFEALYATPQAKLPATLPSETSVRPISEQDMERISHFPTPSTVLAVGKIARAPFVADSLAQGLTLALDGVQDAGNVGTLLRVADWFGFDRVLLSPDCADLFHQKVINASMGSFARVRAHTVELPVALASAGSATPIFGCDLSGHDVHALAVQPNAIVVIGSEGRGLSAAVRPLVTSFITIPKYGAAESLNAAVAAGIICDNLRRALR